MFKFENGTKIKDLVTGFEGIIISRTQFLNKCIRYCVEAPVDKDGKMDEPRYFDENQLIEISGGLIPPKKEEELRPTGGPQRSDPPRL